MNNLSKRLEEHKKTLSDPLSPVPSPTMDAPSPGNTPPSGPHEDNIDTVDMDVSDEEGTGIVVLKGDYCKMTNYSLVLFWLISLNGYGFDLS